MELSSRNKKVKRRALDGPGQEDNYLLVSRLFTWDIERLFIQNDVTCQLKSALRMLFGIFTTTVGR